MRAGKRGPRLLCRMHKARYDLTTSCILALLPFPSITLSVLQPSLNPGALPSLPSTHISLLLQSAPAFLRLSLRFSLWLTLVWACCTPSRKPLGDLTAHLLVPSPYTTKTATQMPVVCFWVHFLFIYTTLSPHPWKWLEEKQHICSVPHS